MPFDEFERELHEALERRLAPPGLKSKVMERREQERRRRHSRMIWLERIAASLLVASVAGSAVVGHYAIERRKGEEAKQQVFTALRITNHAFEVMNRQLRKTGNRE